MPQPTLVRWHLQAIMRHPCATMCVPFFFRVAVDQREHGAIAGHMASARMAARRHCPQIILWVGWVDGIVQDVDDGTQKAELCIPDYIGYPASGESSPRCATT